MTRLQYVVLLQSQALLWMGPTKSGHEKDGQITDDNPIGLIKSCQVFH